MESFPSLYDKMILLTELPEDYFQTKPSKTWTNKRRKTQESTEPRVAIYKSFTRYLKTHLYVQEQINSAAGAVTWKAKEWQQNGEGFSPLRICRM